MGKLTNLKAGIEKASKALDMSREARMQRAQDMGFDTENVYYHGTGADIEHFDPERFNTNEKDGDYLGEAFYFSEANNPGRANIYARTINSKNGNPNVIPAHLRMENPLVVSGRGEFPELLENKGMSVVDWYSITPKERAEKIRSWGYDSLIDTDFGQTAVIDPSQIRSVNAAFDPAKKDSANLLASVGGAAVLGGGAIGSQNAEAGPVGVAKALSKTEFDKVYKFQHKDIRTPRGERSKTADLIKESGFNPGAFILPTYKGGDDLIGKAYGNKKGDMVYITPKAGVDIGRGGRPDKVKAGFRPNDLEVLEIEYDGQTTYEAYLNKFNSVNAAFDPAKKDSSNLLAGVGGAAVLGGAALGSDEADAGSALTNFERRAQNPGIYPNVSNEDRSISTHRMAAEIDQDGRAYAFPTIVQMPDGSLHQFDNSYEALEYNKRIGNVKEFPSIEEAVQYSDGGMKAQYPQLEDFARTIAQGLSDFTQRRAAKRDYWKMLKNVSLEGMAGVNRGLVDTLNFVGPDQVNAVLQLSGSDNRIPTFSDIPGVQQATQGGYMEPGTARDVVRTGSEFLSPL